MYKTIFVKFPLIHEFVGPTGNWKREFANVDHVLYFLIVQSYILLWHQEMKH